MHTHDSIHLPKAPPLILHATLGASFATSASRTKTSLTHMRQPHVLRSDDALPRALLHDKGSL